MEKVKSIERPVLTIQRANYHVDALFGDVYLNGNRTKFLSMELPWDDNANRRGVSPILAGEYPAQWFPQTASGKFTKTGIYLLEGTEPRTEVMLHVANRARKELRGCIAFGMGHFQFDDCLGLRSSTMACRQLFNDLLGRRDCLVRVVDDSEHA